METTWNFRQGINGENMKFVKIIAIIRPDTLDEVENKLRRLNVAGMCISKVSVVNTLISIHQM